MVNKPLTRPYFLGGVALGGAARIPLILRVHFKILARQVTPNLGEAYTPGPMEHPPCSGDSWMYPDPNVPLWEIPI